MPGIALREDYNAAGLRTHARRASCPRQVRRLLALAAVYEGRSRTEAASIGRRDRQTLRDWALRFNADGPDGLLNRKGAGRPRLLRVGAKPCFFSSFRSNRLADLAHLLGCTRKSRTSPSSSTARQSQWRRPRILMTISSRCQRALGCGRDRRKRLVNPPCRVSVKGDNVR